MNRTAVIKILDEINVAVIGLSVEHYNHFYDKFGIYDKDYIFKPNYKLGRWDGKIRLFSKSGKTSIHFLEDIVPDLKAFGYKIKLKDNRNPVTYDIPFVDKDTFQEYNVELGDHQVEAINSLIDAQGGIAIAATGAGKSYIIGALLNLLGKYMKFKCLVIVPTTDLVIQTAAEIEVFGNNVGVYHGSEKNLSGTHLVSTWQSLQNNPHIISMYHAVIVDEAHGAKSNVLKSMIMDYASGATFIAGVTGTLPKHEAELKQVNYVLGYPVAKIEGRQLIDMGWLAKLNLKTITLIEEDFKELWERYKESNPEEAANLTYKTFKSTYFPDFTSERTWIKTNKLRNIFLAYLIEKETKRSGNSFVLVNGVDFGKRLAKLIPNSIFIDGTDHTKVRKEIYDLFSTNDNMIVIATFNLASTGLNIKRIFNLYMIDAGKSFIRIIQSIGRGLRKAADKNKVNVYDIASDLKYSKKHMAERKKYYKEQRYVYSEDKIEYRDLINDIISGKDIDNDPAIVVY